MGLIGGAIGGFFASMFKLKATGMAVTIVPGMLLFLNSLPLYILMVAISIGAGFALTYTMVKLEK